MKATRRELLEVIEKMEIENQKLRRIVSFAKWYSGSGLCDPKAVR